MAEPLDFRPMKIAQILDKTTLVVIGPGAAALNADDQLQVLAVGREIPGTGIPLIVPKATVSVTTAAGEYAVAKTGTYQVEVSDDLSLRSWVAAVGAKRTETRRYQLTVDESQVVGNPASTPVSVGDPVIKPGDLAKFIAYLKAGGIAEFVPATPPSTKPAK